MGRTTCIYFLFLSFFSLSSPVNGGIEQEEEENKKRNNVGMKDTPKKEKKKIKQLWPSCTDGAKEEETRPVAQFEWERDGETTPQKKEKPRPPKRRRRRRQKMCLSFFSFLAVAAAALDGLSISRS
jgi:hypothetical protein